VRRIERWLATARVFLAISALIAVLMDYWLFTSRKEW
jgi:hypothetical protein